MVIRRKGKRKAMATVGGARGVTAEAEKVKLASSSGGFGDPLGRWKTDWPSELELITVDGRLIPKRKSPPYPKVRPKMRPTFDESWWITCPDPDVRKTKDWILRNCGYFFSEDLGRFAIEEQNKKQDSPMEFIRVLKARVLPVPESFYDLTMEVIEDGEKRVYLGRIRIDMYSDIVLLDFKPDEYPSPMPPPSEGPIYGLMGPANLCALQLDQGWCPIKKEYIK